MSEVNHRQLAVDCFNRTWDYLDQPQRSAQEELDMIHCAHASRYHWGFAGGALEWARGEWQLSRVYAVVHHAASAIVHAQACLSLTEDHQLGAFDEAFAHEALARAYRELQDLEQLPQHHT